MNEYNTALVITLATIWLSLITRKNLILRFNKMLICPMYALVFTMSSSPLGFGLAATMIYKVYAASKTEVRRYD